MKNIQLFSQTVKDGSTSVLKAPQNCDTDLTVCFKEV